METIKLYFTSSNVDNIIESCNNFVLQGASYEYCCVNRTIKISSNTKYEMSCDKASGENWGSKIEKLECTGIC